MPPIPPPSPAPPHRLRGAWAVFRKEWFDALRDRRTLATVLLSAVLMGPLALFALSSMVASMERAGEQREVLVLGLAHAPGLANHLARQGLEAVVAPADAEQLLREQRLGEPVLVVPAGAEALSQQGGRPVYTLLFDGSQRGGHAAAGRLGRLVEGYTRERATLALALRGLSPGLLAPAEIEEHDVSSAGSRAGPVTGILPFFVIMAVLYGALGAALDTTAGERERGSLEALLATPASPLALVLGKWGAVAAVAMLIALLSVLSFLPAQALIRSDSLRALFQFGEREAALLLVLLLPLAASLSALMMAVAIGCRTVKEAQASNAVLILAVSLLPLASLFNEDSSAGWQLAVPALAQHVLMNRVLRGEALGPLELLLPLAVSAALTLAALAWLAARLRRAAVQ